MGIIIYKLINTTHIHISIPNRQQRASPLHHFIQLAIYSSSFHSHNHTFSLFTSFTFLDLRKEIWVQSMRPTLFLPISTLLFLFSSSTTIPFIITYSIHPSQNKHSTLISNHSLPNTLLRKNQGNSLRSLNIYSLCMRIHSNHDERRVTQQSPRYELLRRSKDSRRTRLRHRNHLLNARVCCCAMLCTALH